MVQTDADRVVSHLRRMRLLAVVFLATLPTAGVVVVLLPRLQPPALSRTTITVAAVACALWFAFTADRFARTRIARAKDAFGHHGELDRLLTDHLRVYLAVLLRLEVLTLCALATAVWGSGPTLAIAMLVTAFLLMLLAWPTAHKTRLLLQRTLGE